MELLLGTSIVNPGVKECEYLFKEGDILGNIQYWKFLTVAYITLLTECRFNSSNKRWFKYYISWSQWLIGPQFGKIENFIIQYYLQTFKSKGCQKFLKIANVICKWQPREFPSFIFIYPFLKATLCYKKPISWFVLTQFTF